MVDPFSLPLISMLIFLLLSFLYNREHVLLFLVKKVYIRQYITELENDDAESDNPYALFHPDKYRRYLPTWAYAIV